MIRIYFSCGSYSHSSQTGNFVVSLLALLLFNINSVFDKWMFYLFKLEEERFFSTNFTSYSLSLDKIYTRFYKSENLYYLRWERNSFPSNFDYFRNSIIFYSILGNFSARKYSICYFSYSVYFFNTLFSIITFYIYFLMSSFSSLTILHSW